MDQEIDQQRIDVIYEMLLEMAEGNFAYRIPRTRKDDELEALTVLVNWMAEEMKGSLFHAGFTNPHLSYQYLAQSSFIVDNKFIIKDFTENVTDLLGCTSNELLELDFMELLVKESVPLLETILPEVLQNESFQTSIALELASFKKLVVPVNCTISRLYGSAEVVISFIAATADDNMKNFTTEKKILTAEEQKIHNYLDVKSTQAVYDYILANIDSGVPTLKVLSRIFGTNEYKLKNGFKHVFKTTIQQFYNTERLKRAQLLIQYTKIPLKTIAIMTGFSTYPNFSRAFKIKFGYSPSDLERQMPKI
ncbi:helix-turn-helix domain-containing protein [Flavobacterium sp. GT3P67]|uniref:helix-turn-helix domain-containing protein n=1 Tax=Flavobacterium sp. GT3P67 TaxID=2541722 RepID=UPI00104E63BA|nr:helix-turn-helix domain-containing protein [Flavobacterium sp. GT3P67]TDE52737.1 helix-turn-helix domain-containing protein [Flavobacterium sp. GT3P67]